MDPPNLVCVVTRIAFDLKVEALASGNEINGTNGIKYSNNGPAFI